MRKLGSISSGLIALSWLQDERSRKRKPIGKPRKQEFLAFAE